MTVNEDDREAAILYLWDEGLVRPESLGAHVLDALIELGWGPNAALAVPAGKGETPSGPKALREAADSLEIKSYWRNAREFGETGTPYANGARRMEEIALRWMRSTADALETSPSETGTAGPIPLYGMLDVWMALGLDSDDFEPYYEKHGYAETWARIIHGVRAPAAVPAGKGETPDRGQIAQTIRGVGVNSDVDSTKVSDILSVRVIDRIAHALWLAAPVAPIAVQEEGDEPNGPGRDSSVLSQISRATPTLSWCAQPACSTVGYHLHGEACSGCQCVPAVQGEGDETR